MARKPATEIDRLMAALALADRKVECVGKALDVHRESEPPQGSKDRLRWEKAMVEFDARLKTFQEEVARAQAALDKALLR